MIAFVKKNCTCFFLFFRMDANNPWQVESREAFYCLKCPECMYFTTDDNGFYNHAVENHPLSGTLFGKPKDETIDPKEILNFLVKNEPPEDSFENEDNETLPEKSFETFDQTNVLKRKSFENLKTLYQGGIDCDTKPENTESLIETMYGMSENSFEVKSDEGNAIKSNLKRHMKLNHEGSEVQYGSIMNANQENLCETDKSEIDVKSTSNETEGIKILDAIKEHIEKLKNDKDKLSEFINTISHIPGSEDESIQHHGKKIKIECKYCHGIFNKQSITKHEVNCELYQQLIINEKQCSVCRKTFVNRQAINQHLGHTHKVELMKLPKSAEKSHVMK